MKDESIAHMRMEYAQHSLDTSDVRQDPVQQFQQWFEEAVTSRVPEPNAMTLATISSEGKPSARIVLLKEIEDASFVFYTNYHSRKGQEMEVHPQVALTFFWPALERQVRIEGSVHKISETQSAQYFLSRPRNSQIGAWASPQSQKIESRSALDERWRKFEKKFEGQTVPKPEHWGGYAVTPYQVEFWQGRPSRLHDRILYIRQPDNGWKIERLAP